MARDPAAQLVRIDIIEGFSAELAAKPWRNGILRFAGEYANSRYDSFLYDPLLAQKGPARDWGWPA